MTDYGPGIVVRKPFPESARKALRDSQLRRNIGKATSHIRLKRGEAVHELPDWQELREAGRAIKERTLGAEHPTLANSLIGLANVQVRLARYAEAEPLLVRALAIKERGTGPEHPEVVAALLGLADLRLKQGKPDLAEPECRRALAVCEKTLGPGHSDLANCLDTLGEIERAQGHPIEAESVHKRFQTQADPPLDVKLRFRTGSPNR